MKGDDHLRNYLISFFWNLGDPTAILLSIKLLNSEVISVPLTRVGADVKNDSQDGLSAYSCPDISHGSSFVIDNQPVTSRLVERTKFRN